MKRWQIMTFTFLTLLLLMGCSLEELYLGAYIDSKASDLETPLGTDETPVMFTIEPGQSVAEIAGDLKAHGLIDDTELFRRYLQYRKLDAGIQAGTYELRQTMTIPEIAGVFQDAQATEQQVTIPEGKRLEEVAALVADQTTITAEDFLTMAQSGWRDTTLAQSYDFLAQIPISHTLEGFLFPDTYRLSMNATAQDLIQRMLDNFDRQVTTDVREGFGQQNLTLYEGIALASVVEREAVVPAERPLIAGVYYNRLRDGWPLSADPTVQYALGYDEENQTWWKRRISFDDLEVQSPYNTYRNVGLPPGPIANPGADAIRATAQPADTPYYFFMVECSKQDGSHVFALNEAEHLENYNRCSGVNTAP